MTERLATVPRDPLRAFRVPDRVWFAALAIARKRGLKLSEVLRKALEDLIEDDDTKGPR